MHRNMTLRVDNISKSQVVSRRKLVIYASICQYFAIAFYFFIFLEHLTKFINEPLARVGFFILLIWQLVGVVIYSLGWEVKNSAYYWLSIAIFILVFWLPLLCFALLGQFIQLSPILIAD